MSDQVQEPSRGSWADDARIRSILIKVQNSAHPSKPVLSREDAEYLFEQIAWYHREFNVTLNDHVEALAKIDELQETVQQLLGVVEKEIDKLQPAGIPAGVKLSKKQREIYDFLASDIARNRYSPTIREIGDAVGLHSSSSVHRYLTVLQEKGLIKRDPAKPRAIQIV